MAKKHYPSAPTYKPKAKGHNKTKSAKLKGFDIKRINAKSKSKKRP